MKDLVGQTFGKLTVIKKAPLEEDGFIRWICKCECGNEKIVKTRNLTTFHTCSCGCLRKPVEIIGQTFGNLLVKSKFYSKKVKHVYKCECKLCGRMCKVADDDLLNGNIIDCGCKSVTINRDGKILEVLPEKAYLDEINPETGKKRKEDKIVIESSDTNRYKWAMKRRAEIQAEKAEEKESLLKNFTSQDLLMFEKMLEECAEFSEEKEGLFY